jgi:septal ring-binding cell division protein DamX
VEPPAVAVKEASKTPAKTESPAAKKAPAKEPARQSPNPVADPGATAPTSPPATESAKEAATAVAEAPESAPAQDKSVAATATAAAPKAKKALPKAGGGSWAVVVESFAAEPEAYRRLNRVEGAGFVADVVPAQINGQTWHRVIVGGYASQDDAKTVATDLRGRGLGQAWVMQRKAE